MPFQVLYAVRDRSLAASFLLRPVLFLLNAKVRNCAELILNFTCLCSPLQEGHAHTIQTLLSLGADVHAKDGKSRSGKAAEIFVHPLYDSESAL